MFVFFLCFSFLSKKTPKTGHNKNPKKTKTDRKNGQPKSWLAQLCSQIVFIHFWGGLKKFIFCWNHYKNSGFSIFCKRKMAPQCQKGWVKSWSKVESKLGPSTLCNNIGPSFDSKKMVICVFFLLIVVKNLILSAERRGFLKKTGIRQTKKKWTKFWLKKGYFGPRF